MGPGRAQGSTPGPLPAASSGKRSRPAGRHPLSSDRSDFERYWASDEVTTVREQVLNLYNKPLIPTWHTVIAAEAAAALPR